jgi:hypothetical protein
VSGDDLCAGPGEPLLEEVTQSGVECRSPFAALAAELVDLLHRDALVHLEQVVAGVDRKLRKPRRQEVEQLVALAQDREVGGVRGSRDLLWVPRTFRRDELASACGYPSAREEHGYGSLKICGAFA